ncbi:21277_t:CDS:2, partial [Gigaspora rosea]
NKVGKDEPKVYVSRPKFLPVLYYNEDDQVNYVKSEPYRIKFGKENLTEGCEVFEAAQNKAPECGNQKDNISKEDLDSA